MRTPAAPWTPLGSVGLTGASNAPSSLYSAPAAAFSPRVADGHARREAIPGPPHRSRCHVSRQHWRLAAVGMPSTSLGPTDAWFTLDTVTFTKRLPALFRYLRVASTATLYRLVQVPIGINSRDHSGRRAEWQNPLGKAASIALPRQATVCIVSSPLYEVQLRRQPSTRPSPRWPRRSTRQGSRRRGGTGGHL